MSLPPARRSGDALVRKQRAAIAAAAAWTDRAFIGEFGWPHNAPDSAEWNALGADLYAAFADAAHAPKQFSLAQTATVEQLRIAKAIGCDEAIIDLNWNAFGAGQPSRSILDPQAVAEKTALIAECARLGMRVILSINPQYCNEWVAANVPPFRDQHGMEWRGTAGDGYNVRDWFFTAIGRREVAAWIKQCAIFDSPAVVGIRFGFGIYGELQYPPTAGADPQWWSFGAAGQSGAGLATGMNACPQPGFVPYQNAGAYDAQTRAVVDWHIASIARFGAWLVGEMRAAFPRQRLYVLHPSYGLRRNLDPASGGYKDDASKGTDPSVVIPAYLAVARENVRPWCTSGDHAGNWVPNATNPNEAESDWAAWFHLEQVAARYGIVDGLRAENTDRAGNDGMARMFSAGGVLGRAAYDGAMWLHLPGLLDGSQGSLTALRAQMQRIDPRCYLTGWADSDWLGAAYPLSAYLGDGTPLETAAVHEQAQRYPSLLVGRNLAGAEFPGVVPGVVETNYHYPTAANLAALRANHYDLVRVPFLWERVQPTPNSDLDPAAVQTFTALLDAALRHGLRVVPDLHNYARYNGQPLTSADAASLADFWLRFIAHFGAHPALWGLGLMNEPHDLRKEEGEPTSAALYDFATGVGSWTGGDDSEVVSFDPTDGLVLEKRKDDAGYLMARIEDHDPRLVSAAGGTALTALVSCPANASGELKAGLRYQNDRWVEQRGDKTTYQDEAGNFLPALRPGQITLVRTTFAQPIPAGHRGLIVQLEGRGQPAGATRFTVRAVGVERAADGPRTPAQVWEAIEREAVSTIRGSGYVGLLCASTYEWSHLQGLTAVHPKPFIDPKHEPIRFELHAYPDLDLSGRFETSFAAALQRAIDERF